MPVIYLQKRNVLAKFKENRYKSATTKTQNIKLRIVVDGVRRTRIGPRFMIDPAPVWTYRIVYFSLIHFIIVDFNMKQNLYKREHMNLCNYCPTLIMFLMFINVV